MTDDSDVLYFSSEALDDKRSSKPTLLTDCSVPWLQNENVDKKDLAMVRFHNEVKSEYVWYAPLYTLLLS